MIDKDENIDISVQRVDFKNKKLVDYDKVLEMATDYLTQNFSDTILNLFDIDNKEEVKKQIFVNIKKYLQDNSLAVENISTDELIEKIYTDSFEFGFLNKYIFDENVEEINGNSWDCIYVNYSDGRIVKLDEKFQDEEQTLSVIRRILSISRNRVNDAEPIALGEIGKNRRITVIIPPIVDEEVGVTFSLRNVNSNSVSKTTFLEKGTATQEMLDFLELVLRYGTSICIAGGTGSGKTTLTNWLLSTIPNNKRIYTIESGSRELDLIKRDENGNIINNVISTETKENKNKEFCVDQDKLLAIALRYHPDIICVGEMRDKEAYTAQEASRTGHNVITTVHAESAEDTYDRILSLCLKADANINDERLFEYIIRAFPIVIFAKQLEDKSRKIMEIMESYIDDDKKVRFNPIFNFEVEETKLIDGKTVIVGNHKKVGGISEKLAKRLMNNGMPTNDLNKLRKE
ncbi:CpaF/VirB11 family protein [uncultured Tyzzerella sp.]|uniref:CpaF/VirB11 family protein n=1 Tax=uncultured Tyzzerella sp. TaxID=2321398 RepID=UPI002943D4F3|nr:CpaF/VirB11 family protein [uncultured Tyzzerella sp.]